VGGRDRERLVDRAGSTGSSPTRATSSSPGQWDRHGHQRRLSSPRVDQCLACTSSPRPSGSPRRPDIRQLAEAEADPASEAYAAAARRVNLLGGLTTAIVVLIVFLMVTKPF
jgi:hypothetical protein